MKTNSEWSPELQRQIQYVETLSRQLLEQVTLLRARLEQKAFDKEDALLSEHMKKVNNGTIYHKNWAVIFELKDGSYVYMRCPNEMRGLHPRSIIVLGSLRELSKEWQAALAMYDGIRDIEWHNWK